MDKNTIMIPEEWLIPPGEITDEQISEKANQMAEALRKMVEGGVAFVVRGVEMGGLLETKRAQLGNDDAFSSWFARTIPFSRQSGDNYRKLWKGRHEVRKGIEEGVINSIRTALKILDGEPRDNNQASLPGLDPEVEVRKGLLKGETAQEIAGKLGMEVEGVWKITKKIEDAAKPKTSTFFEKIWRVFSEPQKTSEAERQALANHTAHGIRISKELGLKLPGIKTIEMEEIK